MENKLLLYFYFKMGILLSNLASIEYEILHQIGKF